MSTPKPAPYRALDLAAAANRGFTAVAGRGQAGGWTGEPGNDLRGLQPGPLAAGRMTFTIADPAANRNRAVVALRHRDCAFRTRATLAAGGEACDWIYLLHATSWIPGGEAVGTLTLAYADGSEAVLPIRQGGEVADWWNEDDPDHGLRLTLRGANPANPAAALFACALANPHPRRRLARLDFALAPALGPKCTWLIPAVAVGCGGNRLAGPARVAVTADPGRELGAIRRLHGANIGAPIFLDALREQADRLLRELEIPVTRLHDCPWDNAGLKLVDVHQIFPLFHADHHDPANYFFAHTDDFIANCLANGSQPYYRLGVSIEHMPRNHFTIPPADFVKWSEICINIIRHYNEGWAGGFHHGITCWEIWNEANLGRQMWSGSWDDYIRLYVTAARLIKEACPQVQVGGPGLAGASPELIARLLVACREHGAPLDFLSWHKYGSSVEAIVAQPGEMKALLTAHGFPRTELHLNEWHYVHGPWLLAGPGAAATAAGWNGPDGAAYLCAVLSGWQDTPLDMGHYYTSSNMPWFGLFDAFGEPNACWYAMKCFAELTRHPRRFAVTVPEGGRVWALGGSDGQGRSAILLSCLKGSPRTITLRIAGRRLARPRLTVRMLDAVRRLEAVEPSAVAGDTLTLRKPAGSAVFLVTW
jgi:hypothetical protein